MSASRRWQDWAAVLLGVILFATPFIFETRADTASSWTAHVIGALFVVAGLWSASTEEPDALIEGVPLILAFALMVAPWLLGYTGIVTMAWMSWIIGIAAVGRGSPTTTPVRSDAPGDPRRGPNGVGWTSFDPSAGKPIRRHSMETCALEAST